MIGALGNVSAMQAAIQEKASKAATAATAAGTAARQGLATAKGNALQGLEAAKGNALQGLEAARKNSKQGLDAAKEKLNSATKQAPSSGEPARSVATPMRAHHAGRPATPDGLSKSVDREAVQMMIDVGIDRDVAVQALRMGTAEALVASTLAGDSGPSSEFSSSQAVPVPAPTVAPNRAAMADAAEQRVAAARARGMGTRTMEDYRRESAEARLQGISRSSSKQETVSSRSSSKQETVSSRSSSKQSTMAAQQESDEDHIHTEELLLQHALAESLQADQERHNREFVERCEAGDSCCAAATSGDETKVELPDMEIPRSPQMEAAVSDGAFSQKPFMQLASVGTWLLAQPH